ncbi:hypothetical protein Elgi_68920 [Paenibacillus elgii]|uniref:hypothetical protein n=1 Tax=Paenibacillus elgii TaxID=189691 RepID=UPI002D7B1F87|nr:hypothetical protein Elgi_68920 [Paenibacillus elgii]
MSEKEQAKLPGTMRYLAVSRVAPHVIHPPCSSFEVAQGVNIAFPYPFHEQPEQKHQFPEL